MTMHELDAYYGTKLYYVNEKSAYAQLMFESDLTEKHNLSVGASLNYDYLGQRVKSDPLPGDPRRINERETTPGAYLQYTFKLDPSLTAMAGIRADHSSVYGWFPLAAPYAEVIGGKGLPHGASLGGIQLSDGKRKGIAHRAA